MSARIAKPIATVGWRRRSSRKAARSRRAAEIASKSSGAVVMASIPHARIEHGVAQIHQQIDDHIGRREQQDDALYDGVVAAQDRIDREPADAGDREHGLRHDDAADQHRHAYADDGYDRN